MAVMVKFAVLMAMKNIQRGKEEFLRSWKDIMKFLNSLVFLYNLKTHFWLDSGVASCTFDQIT